MQLRLISTYLTILFLLLLGASFQYAYSQVKEYHGIVIDSKTGAPLPFASILFDKSGKGTTSQIDGSFRISASLDVSALTFSCIGYQPVVHELTHEDPGLPIRIRMEPKAYSIDEVIVYPGINPAHRIIWKVYENRKKNDPEELESFTYDAYNRFHISMNLDSLSEFDTLMLPEFSQNPFSIPDSSLHKLDGLLRKQHLFLMESVSKREFRYPDNNVEKVIASRVSGFKNPTFSIIATQIQSFSFYNDFVRIMEKDFLNPISKGSTNKYLFILADTIFTETFDTLFVISFKPKRGRVFDGLEGFFHINSNGYAIQNVVASAPGPNNMMDIKIQQKYEHLESGHWFPVQLNTDLNIYGPGFGPTSDEGETSEINNNNQLYGVGKTTITNIQLEPELEQKRFQALEFNVEKGATKRSEEFWDAYRSNPLTPKDTTTYHVVDSLGEVLKLDRRLNTFERFVLGYIPVGFLHLDYTSILNYNDYEGIRIGLGAVTNNKLSRYFSLGGYFAYGFRDNRIKYGGKVTLNLKKDPAFTFEVEYRNDVMEPGSHQFLKERTEISSESFRIFLIEEMDQFIMYKASLSYHSHRHLRTVLFLDHKIIHFGNDYLFSYEDTNPQVFLDNTKITEIGFSFRLAYKEKYLKISDQYVSMGTKYPILCGNIIQGVKWFNGLINYTKYEAKIYKIFKTRNIGEIGLTLTGGIVQGNVPFSMLYNGNGSYKSFTVESVNSFATMRMDEFVSDRFLSIFHQHNFGKIRSAGKKFRPELVWINNFGISGLKTGKYHSNLNRITMEKGYYESGILINNLLNQWVFGVGLGAFYRYGPYSLNKTIDNFAFKFTITFNI